MKFLPPQHLIDDGFINVSTSDDGLRLYNYSHKCQFAKEWNKWTLQARGIVVDSEDEIVARPFDKFFNYEERVGTEYMPQWPPSEVYEKIDGSLGIFYVHDGKLRCNTRGSFTSDQSVKALEILEARYGRPSAFILESFADFTHMFEIVYADNRIVLDYGKSEELVYLGSVHTESGKDVGMLMALKSAFPHADEHDARTVEDLLKQDNTNREGFVLRWSNGYRLKLKFEEYVRLHRLLTNVSSKTIWETLKSGASIDEYVKNVPDEFYAFVRKVEKDLRDEFIRIQDQACKAYIDCHDAVVGSYPKWNSKREHKKFFATEAANREHPSILFSMYDNRDYADYIWKLIEPKFVKPFKIEE